MSARKSSILADPRGQLAQGLSAPHIGPHPVVPHSIVAYAYEPVDSAQLLERKVSECQLKADAARTLMYDAPSDLRKQYFFECANAELQEAKIDMHNAAVEAARASFRHSHSKTEWTGMDASPEVFPKLEKFHEAKIEMRDAVFKATRLDGHLRDPKAEKVHVNTSVEVLTKLKDLHEAKVEMCSVALYAARAWFRRNRSETEWPGMDTSPEVFPKLEEFHKANVEMCSVALDAARAAFRCSHSETEWRDMDTSYEVFFKHQELHKAKVEMRNAAVEAARATFRRSHSETEWPGMDTSPEVSSKLEELREAEMARATLSADLKVQKCQAVLDAARAAFRRNHSETKWPHMDTSPEVFPKHEDLHKAKVELCSVALDAARAWFCRNHPKTDWPDMDTSPEVSSKLEGLREAEMARDTLRTELDVEKCQAVLDAARASFRRNHSKTEWSGMNTSPDVSSNLEELREAEMARVDAARAVFRRNHSETEWPCPDTFREVSPKLEELREAEMARVVLPVDLKVENCQARLDAARAAFRRDHSETEWRDMDTSYEVFPKHEELHKAKVELCSVALDAVRAWFRRNHPKTEWPDMDTSREVFPKLEELRQAEMARATLSTDLKVQKCQAVLEAARAAFKRDHSETEWLNMDTSREVFPKLEEFHKAKVEMCSVALDAARAWFCRNHSKTEWPGMDTSPEVSPKLRELGEAQIARDTLRTVLNVEKYQAVLEAARAAFRDANPKAADDVDEGVLCKLKMLHSARVEMCDAAVEAARAAFLRSNPRHADIDACDYVSSRRRMLMEAKTNRDVLQVELVIKQCKKLMAKVEKGLEKEVDTLAVAAQLKRSEAERDYLDANLRVEELKLDAAAAKPDDKVMADLESAKLLLSQRASEHSKLREISFATVGLPLPVELTEGCSIAPPTPHCTSCSLEGMPFEPLSACPMEIHESVLWPFRARPGYRNAVCGAALVGLVEASAEDAINACGVSYSIRLQAALKDRTPDLAIVSKSGAFLSVIHVKKHDSASENDFEHAMRQHLSSLRTIHGISYPIGILTNYNGWQFFWPEYAAPVAEATTLEEIHNLPPSPPTEGKLKLCASKVYGCRHPSLHILLASFMLKLAAIPRGATRESWTVFSRDSESLVSSGPTFEELILDQMPCSDAEEFTEVKFLGSGTDGSAYILTTNGQTCCVGKFVRNKRDDEEESLADRECKAWCNAYGEDCKVRVAVLNNKPVLLMPYHETLTNDDWEDPATLTLVMEHIRWLLESRGVRHHDIERRHVVWVTPSQMGAAELEYMRKKLIEAGAGNNEAQLTLEDLRAMTGFKAVRLIDWGEAANNEAMRVRQSRKARKSKTMREYLEYARSCLKRDGRALDRGGEERDDDV